MQTTRWMRLGLAVVFLAALAAIIISLTSRQADAPEPVEQPLLEPDVESQSTRFEYSEKEEGRTVFRVEAEKSTQRNDGRHELDDVLLELHTPDGQVSDTIRGRRALYRMGESKVEFSEDVEIRLMDGTQIHSQQVRADLDEETILIDQQFSFRRGEAAGLGQRLLYRIQMQVAEISAFRVQVPSSQVPISVSSTQAVYDLGRHYVKLTGNSTISRVPTLLTARQIEVWMDESDRLKRLLSQGSARFAPRAQQAFSGHLIDKTFDPATGRLLRLEVKAAPQGEQSAPVRAAFREESPAGTQRLEADLIVGRPTQARGQGADVWLLKELEARGDSRFTSQPLRIREALSQLFLLHFASDGRQMESLILQDEVAVLRQEGTEDRESTQRLFSSRVDLKLDEHEQLRRARVAGPARLEVNRSGTFRRLTAQEGLRFGLQQGRLEEMQAWGGCRLDSREGQKQSSIQTPEIRVRFREGRPLSAWAGEGVEVEMEERRTSSRELTLEYESGVLARAVQSGLFSLLDPSAGIELEGEEAVYRPLTNQVRVEGGEKRRQLVYRRPVKPGEAPAQPIRTTAQEFVIDRSSGNVTALRQVRTRLQSGPEFWLLEAQRMKLDQDSQSVVYDQSPSLRQADSLFRGKRILLSTAGQDLRLEGDVYSRFRMNEAALADKTNPASRQSYEIRSQALQLDPSGSRAEYRGEVFLKSDQLEVEAPNMDIVQLEAEVQDAGGPVTTSVNESGQAAAVRRITAWDEVEIRLADGRRALGQRLVYNPASDEGVLTGQPVQVFQPDPKSGKTRKLQGARLLFKVNSESFELRGTP
ncbi:MAG TPA: LPS export ABC transporter periplasmic protein LptC [Acidobacteriota bacterium]|nr:LPS export ABC transporter periplasmic protein LptC [Acidobacteriota bacterium]